MNFSKIVLFGFIIFAIDAHKEVPNSLSKFYRALFERGIFSEAPIWTLAMQPIRTKNDISGLLMNRMHRRELQVNTATKCYLSQCCKS